MTKQELKKLNRTDLIEMLLALSKENEQLRAELEEVKQQLVDRTLKMENVGSLAEAALTLNGVFEAAQAAAEQYVESVRQRSQQQEEICAQMEQAAREKCSRMMLAAKKQADDYLARVNSKVRELNDSYSWQTELSDEIQETDSSKTV